MTFFQGAMSRTASFGRHLIRHKVQRAIALGMYHDHRDPRSGKMVRFDIKGMSFILSPFSAEGLQRFIAAHRSLIDEWGKLVPADLRTWGIEDIRHLQLMDLRELVGELNFDQILDHVARRKDKDGLGPYPELVAVIRRNAEWLESESRRAREVMLQVLAQGVK